MSTAACEEDILQIKKRLDKMIKVNEVDVQVSIDMLNTLKSLPVDFNILKNTGVGITLNSLRKSCNSEELGTLAKGLLKSWKKLVSSTTSQSIGYNAASPNSNSNDSSSKPLSPAATPATPTTPTQVSTRETLKRVASESPENAPSAKAPQSKKWAKTTADTSDPVRLKCREMLAAALELTESIENGATLCDANEVAARCEDVIFNEFKDTGLKYKNRVRSRVINLKDARNPRFRENVRLGLITADRLATMTAEEMASDELKELRAKFTKQAIDDHQMARTQGAKTSLLTCSKCKKNNVVYSEMQTRSADEPMTTFAYCQECGHRWKFC